MRALPLVGLLAACGACARLREVEALFERERAEAVFALPATATSSPARAEGAPAVMAGTAERARRFLAAECDRESDERLARAFLACAQMLRGENAAARETLAAFPAHPDPPGGRRAALLEAARCALGASDAADARAAFERLLAGDGDARAFLEEHGRLLGLDLPPPGAPLRDETVAREAARLRAAWFPEVAGDPRGLPRTAAARRQVRATLGEQLYDDAAALLLRLDAVPEDDPAGAWLAAVAAAALAVHAHQLPDLLPEHLSEEQKQWAGEQAASAFLRARRAAARFVSEAERRRIEGGELPDEASGAWSERRLALYAALVRAEAEAMGWIRAR